jgi:hypothetical protein
MRYFTKKSNIFFFLKNGSRYPQNLDKIRQYAAVPVQKFPPVPPLPGGLGRYIIASISS